MSTARSRHLTRSYGNLEHEVEQGHGGLSASMRGATSIAGNSPGRDAI